MSASRPAFCSTPSVDTGRETFPTGAESGPIRDRLDADSVDPSDPASVEGPMSQLAPASPPSTAPAPHRDRLGGRPDAQAALRMRGLG